MSSRSVRIGVLLVALSVAVSASSAMTSATRPARAGMITWARGSWSWFGDLRAVHVVGQYDQTFVGWIDWTGAVTIGAYDARFGVLRTHVVGRLFHDDHSAPSIFVEPDRRLTVFWSGHDGGSIDYRSTLRPEDIGAWGPLGHISPRISGADGYTYPNPVLVPSERNKLYLFFRGRDWSADLITRTIDGRWGRPHRVIAAPGQRPYLKVDTNGWDTVALAFTNGHPREESTSVYYAAYRDGALWGANGRVIARLRNGPMAPRRGDLVYDERRSGISAWVWDVALDSHQRPVIAYATFPSLADHAYWYARWTGSRWVSHLMTHAGPSISPGTIEQQYSGGLTLDHADPSIVFLSRRVAGSFEIERWQTSDGGWSWSHSTVASGGGPDEVRPVVPRGWDSGPMGLVWLRGEYVTYTSYRTWITLAR